MVKQKRKKKRTHVTTDEEGPHTFVINKGNLGKAGLSLMLDIRKSLEPLTARNLKARKYNKIKDYIHVSAQYGVSHLLLLSRSLLGFVNLRVSKVPRGPTMTFRVSNYMLLKDVMSSLKRAKSMQKVHESAPLLIMNGFDENIPHHKLITTTFQNMLPAVNVKTVKLNTLKRCILMNYSAEEDVIEFRHYHISASPVGVNRAVKKLLKKVPDLSKYSDISEFLTNGYFSESDGEDNPDSQVVLPQKLAGRGNLKSNRSAIRLTELGPKMTLKLMKIEEGVGEGEVLYHSYIKKTAEEKKELRKRIEKKKLLKEKRKKEQEKNVERKKAGEQTKKPGDKRKRERIVDDASEDDDVEYYKQEIGQAPDAELLLKTKQTRRSKAYKEAGNADEDGVEQPTSKKPEPEAKKPEPEAKKPEPVAKKPEPEAKKSKPDQEEDVKPKGKQTARSKAFKSGGGKAAKKAAKGTDGDKKEVRFSADTKTQISHTKSTGVKGVAFRRKK